jgi:hypothetical protein
MPLLAHLFPLPELPPTPLLIGVTGWLALVLTVRQSSCTCAGRGVGCGDWGGRDPGWEVVDIDVIGGASADRDGWTTRAFRLRVAWTGCSKRASLSSRHDPRCRGGRSGTDGNKRRSINQKVAGVPWRCLPSVLVAVGAGTETELEWPAEWVNNLFLSSPRADSVAASRLDSRRRHTMSLSLRASRKRVKGAPELAHDARA